MGRHVAVRKAPTPADAGGAVAGRAAGTGIGSTIGGALGSIIPGAGTAAGASIGGSMGGAVGGAVGKVGAKKIAVGAAEMAQNQANAQAAQQQQTMQNNIQSAKDTAQQAKDQAGIAKMNEQEMLNYYHPENAVQRSIDRKRNQTGSTGHMKHGLRNHIEQTAIERANQNLNAGVPKYLLYAHEKHPDLQRLSAMNSYIAENMPYTDKQRMRSGQSAPIARELNMSSSLLDNQRQYIENQMMPPGPYIQPEQKIEEIPGTGMVWINGKGPFTDPREQKSEPIDLAWQMLFKAGIAKAWMFPARMMHPEFKSYRDSIIERAKKAPRQDEDFRQDQHWNERMGHKEGRPEEARYIPNQHFEHEGEVHNITPFQVAYATMQHMKENRLIDEDNHDAVALRELLHTDQPHPDPHNMQNQMAHIFSPVMDIETLRGKSAHADPINPKGARTQHLYAQDVVKPDDMTLPSQSVGVKKPSRSYTQWQNKEIIDDEAQRLHFGNFMTEPINYKNMQARGLSHHITPKIASQRVLVRSPYVQGGLEANPLQPIRGEGNLRRQFFNAPVNVRARQKQQEAEEAARKQAEEDALAQQPITITPFGVPGMYDVLDPAEGPKPKMMSHMEAVAAGYEQYLPVQTSEPMDLAWQMLFKAGVEVHHDEPLPQEFTQDIATLDRNHQMMPTENGTMINNISPHMLRTIELMAQNHKDDETFTPKPFEMPTTFH